MGLRAIAEFAEAFENAPDERNRLIATLDDARRESLSPDLLALLATAKYARQDKVRCGAIEIFIHNGARGLGEIAKLLRRRTQPIDYEVHFSLFVRMERDRYQSPKLQRRVLQLFAEYLLTVRSEQGAAAWMAGDCLHHWGTPAAKRILLRMASGAHYPAGRIGAIHGLQHLLNKATPPEHRRIVKLLRRSLVSDSSRKVRSYVDWTLKSGGCWTENRPDGA